MPRRRPSTAVIWIQHRAENGGLSAATGHGVATFRDPDGSLDCATGLLGFAALTRHRCARETRASRWTRSREHETDILAGRARCVLPLG